MRPPSYWIASLLIFLCGVVAAPAFCGETMAPEGDGSGANARDSDQAGKTSPWDKDASAWNIAMYPVYVWAPVFGAHINFPDIGIPPGGGNGGPGILNGKVSGSFNGAGFVGFDIEKSRVVAHGAGLFASVSADSSNPKVHVGMNAIYGEAFGGYEILRGLSLEAGVRRMALRINASVDDRPGITAKPGIWDPQIGMTWKQKLARKWMLKAHFDGGGFGVGSDVDLQASARVDWRFFKHFGISMGAAALHFQFSRDFLDNTRFSRTLKFSQTMYGPLFGLGIYF